MLTILLFVIVLSSLIFVHEFGHFFTARKLGVGVEEFGFGFPPRLFGLRRRSGVIYSLNAIPFGGFVRLKGEQAAADPTDQTSFVNARLTKRAIIVGSGVVMNLVLTVLLFFIGYQVGVPAVVSDTLPGAKIRDQRVVITGVLEPSPAAAAGLRRGDTVREIQGQPVTTVSAIQSAISQSAGATALVIERDGKREAVAVVPAVLDQASQKKIGVDLETLGVSTYPVQWAFVNAFRTTFELSGQVVVAFGGLIRDLVVYQKVSPEVAGPVGIAILTGQVARLGVLAVLQFVALLSLSLGIINLLPFPGLDGGRLFFLLIERIRGHALNQRTEAIIHNVGFALLLLLILTISVQDVQRFHVGERIGQAFQSAFR